MTGHIMDQALFPARRRLPGCSVASPVGLTLVAAILFPVMMGCQDSPSSDHSQPSVLLISIDTLRAQSVGLYGYGRPTTPQLDALGKEAIVFEHAYTPEPQTLPSHTSMLTGLYPARHGVLPTKARRLAEDVTTITEVFQDAGFHTGAVVNVAWLAPQFGLNRAFDSYRFVSQATPNPQNESSRFGRSAEQSCEEMLGWIDTLEGGPFFGFLHLFDVHSDIDQWPYDSPTTFREKFAKSPPPHFDGGRNGTYASEFLNRVNTKSESLSEPELRHIQDLYDAGVAYTDDCLGKFFDALRERGLYQDLILCVVADHGEEFYEHKRMMHTQLFEESVRVPFMIRLPGGVHGGQRVKEPVSLIDVAPTLSQLAGLRFPEADGLSLASRILDAQALAERPLAFNHDLGPLIGWRTGNHKVISHPKFMASFLYRVDKDPGEAHNLASDEPALTASLRNDLRTFRTDSSRDQDRYSAPLNIDDETLESLRKLGYSVH